MEISNASIILCNSGTLQVAQHNNDNQLTNDDLVRQYMAHRGFFKNCVMEAQVHLCGLGDS